jgi:hypothetical protein
LNGSVSLSYAVGFREWCRPFPSVRDGRLVVGAKLAVCGTSAFGINLLCIAYGSDKNPFADIVKQGYLPEDRAEICEDEYRQVEFAARTLDRSQQGRKPIKTKGGSRSPEHRPARGPRFP